MREQDLLPANECTETAQDVVQQLTDDELQRTAGGLRYPGFEQTT